MSGVLKRAKARAKAFRAELLNRGRILPVPLLFGEPEFVPVVVVAGMLERRQIRQAFLGPKMGPAFEPIPPPRCQSDSRVRNLSSCPWVNSCSRASTSGLAVHHTAPGPVLTPVRWHDRSRATAASAPFGVRRLVGALGRRDLSRRAGRPVARRESVDKSPHSKGRDALQPCPYCVPKVRGTQWNASRHAQASPSAEVVPAASPLPSSLHSHQFQMTESGRSMVWRTDGQTNSPWTLRECRGLETSH